MPYCSNSSKTGPEQFNISLSEYIHRNNCKERARKISLVIEEESLHEVFLNQYYFVS